MLLLFEPTFQVQLLAPEAASTAVSPTHNSFGEELITFICGKAKTVMVDVFEELQPLTSLPVTVQLDVTVGVTVADPDEKVYVIPPTGVRMKVFPAHMEPLLMVMRGAGLTDTEVTAVLLQVPLMPITV